MNKIDVNSHLMEFGYELLSTVPYAKWLYDNDMLGKTTSGKDTKVLYWWNKNHVELNQIRGWTNRHEYFRSKIPNVKIHIPNYDFNKFSNPRWADHYKNNIFVYEKPILCICNRVNVEWKKGIINHFDLSMLNELFRLLKSYYQIIYFNIEGRRELYDGGTPISIGDYGFIRNNHSDVLIIHDLYKQHPEFTFNQLQLMIFANCSNFITMNGGYSIMASYFPGTNIIYSKVCRELDSGVNSFYRWYPKLGGQRIVVVNSYESLLEKSKAHFVDKILCFNVASRTFARPQGFHECVKSIMSQTYRNVNQVVTVDDDETMKYTIPYPCLVERVVKLKRETPETFPFNLYFNQLKKYFYPGYVIHLDDDDVFLKNDALEKIAKTMETTNSDMVCFRISFPGNIILPSKENFGKYPISGKFSGGNFAVRTEKWQDWKGIKRGDYDLAARLFDSCKVTWLEDIFISVSIPTSRIREKVIEQGLRNDFVKNLKKFVVPLAKDKVIQSIPLNKKALNIVMLSAWDYGGSGWQIVQAVRNHTSHNIIHVKRFVHKNMFPTEYILENGNRRKIRLLLEKANIVHFKGDEIPLRHWAKFRIPNETKIILTVAGTGFRRSLDGHPSPMAKEWFPFKYYIGHSDFRTALTPDLNYPSFDSVYTQELINSESIDYCWKEKEIPVIGYFPSFKNRKGFDSHIGPALDQLEKMGCKFVRLPTVGMSYKESVQSKKEMTVFIDQITWAGGYGNSALEAMQFGVPVVAYLSEKSLKQSDSEEFKNSPILNPGFTVNGLVELLKKILDRELDLKSISLKTKQYCDTFHSYSRGAKMWDEIYQRVMEG